MYIFLMSLNIILLIIGSLLHITSYIIKTQIVGNYIFTGYFLFVGLQSLTLGVLLTFKNKGRGIPLSKIFNPLTNFSKYLLILLLFIGLIIIFLNISIMSGGGPGIFNGKYVLMDKGNILKEISYEEYMYFQLLNFRNNSYGAVFFNILDILLIRYIFRNTFSQD